MIKEALIKKLEGEIGNMNSTGAESAIVFDKVILREEALADAFANTSSSQRQLNQVTIKLTALRKALGIGSNLTAKQQDEALKKNTEAYAQYLALSAQQIDLERSIAKERVQLALDTAGSIVSSWSGMTGSLKSELKSREQAELDTLKNTDRYKNASNDEQKRMEKSVNPSWAKKYQKSGGFLGVSSFPP